MQVTTNTYDGLTSVTVNKATKSFKFYDYKWSLDITQGDLDMSFNTDWTQVVINGDGWSDSLHTLQLDGHLSLEQCVKAALVWIAEHV